MSAKIRIHGAEYDFPSLDSITIDESIILERYAEVGLEQIEEMDSPPIGVVKALAVIAVLRARPEEKEREVADVIGKLKLGELEFEGADAVPPSGSVSENEDVRVLSGEDGSTDGESSPEKSETPEGSGSPVSGIGAAYAQRISAA